MICAVILLGFIFCVALLGASSFFAGNRFH